jgi:ABC-type enterochelin transport system substrate-binding protein
LLLSDKEAFNKLSELTLKINDIDEMKFSIKQNMEKMVEIHEKVTKVEKVISNFSNKFYEIENIFDNIFKV